MQLARTLLFVAAVAALPVHAQSVSPAWDAYRAGQQPERTQAASQAERGTVADTAAAGPATLPVVDTAAETPRVTHGAAPASAGMSVIDAPRGQFFVAAQVGQAWVIDDVRQDAKAISAGYRWQAGPSVQVGIEGTASRIDGTSFNLGRGSYDVDNSDYATLGANARFQFGSSPMFAMTRLGYWYADLGEGDSVDGGYAGVGLGVDFNRHVNLTLAYTLHAYASSYCVRSYTGSYCGTDVSRADLVTLGLEARF